MCLFDDLRVLLSLVLLEFRFSLIVRQYDITIGVGGGANIPHCLAMVIETWQG